MSEPLRLPPAPHLPGRTPRPDEAVFSGVKAPLDRCSTAADFEGSAAFKAGFQCFLSGYFWEAHECWEAVWIRLPPASRERHLLTALIQLANARLKATMGNASASARILKRASAAWSEAFSGAQHRVLGVSSVDWAAFAGKLA